MDGFTETRFIIIRRIQAERRAEAAAARAVADERRHPAEGFAAEGIGRFRRVAVAFRVNRFART